MLLIILIFLLWSMGAWADYIYLRDGSIISGVLREEQEKLFIYRVPYGEMFINRENITRIVHESIDKPLLREAEKYFKDKRFKRAIRCCEEILEIKPDSIEAAALKQKAIISWQKYKKEKEERIRRQQKEHERKIRKLENMRKALKSKWGLAIKKKLNNYVISDIYYNCPLSRGEIKPGDILTAVQDKSTKGLSIEKVYSLFSGTEKISLTIQRPIVLRREKLSWHGEKEYVGFGISIEKVEKGIRITDLMPDGPAARAGVLKNDIIIKLGRTTISSSSMDDIIKIIKGKPDTSLDVVIERKINID